jgi:hypothetical protein
MQMNAWAVALNPENSWHLRPNLGLDQESDWIAQQPGFQRELHERIEANI